LPRELQEQVDAFKTSELGPGPHPDSWKKRRAAGRRMSVIGKKVKDSGRSTSMIVGSSLVPILENITVSHGFKMTVVTNRLLPVRDRVIFAKDSDEDRGSDSAVSEG
jgi:hypothetical protein